MKALAQVAMKGRWQAMFLTIAGASSALFCWISGAIIALTTLQQGIRWGGYLLFWALLPSGLVLYVYGDPGPVILLVSAWVMAAALRVTGSLSLMLLTSVAVGLLSGLVLLVLGDAYLERLVALFDSFLTNLEQSLQGGQNLALERPGTTQIAGVLAVSNAVLASVSTLLGAYWQSALFRPGLFGREYRRAVLPAGVAVGLLLVALGMYALAPELRSWAAVLLVPLVFTGLGLVHAQGRSKQRGTGFFVAFYVLWAIFDLVKIAVVLLAVVDSVMGLRHKYLAEKTQDTDDDPPSSDKTI